MNSLKFDFTSRFVNLQRISYDLFRVLLRVLGGLAVITRRRRLFGYSIEDEVLSSVVMFLVQ